MSFENITQVNFPLGRGILNFLYTKHKQNFI